MFRSYQPIACGRVLPAFFAIALLAGLPGVSLAEEVSAGEPALEEIIVTAERRAENLQNVALAITAFSGEDLREQGIFDIKGITERTPGFAFCHAIALLESLAEEVSRRDHRHG